MTAESCPSSQALSAFHDGELGPLQREEIKRHVASCDLCAAELDELAGLSRRFAESTTDGELLPIELARLHRSLDVSIGQSFARSSEPAGGSVDRVFLRTATLLSALAASVLIVASAWLWELPGSHVGTQPKQMLAHAEAWEVAAVTLDPLYSTDRIAPGNDTRLADAPIVDFMLTRVIGKGADHETN